MGWTKDNEERSAIALKAQHSYALGRQAMEKATTAETRALEVSAELEEARGELAALRRRVATLEAAFAAATEPAQPRRSKAVGIEATPARKAA